jgi:outer membrane protein assembly factor BamB
MAADFPQWRGPNRDGGISESTRAAWPEKLTQQWRVQVGEGHSSPVHAGGRVYAFARANGKEEVLALDGASGKVLWRQSYPAPYRMNPAATRHGEGPKSTPAVQDGKLYTFGISGILSVWDAGSGRLLWRKEFSKRFRETSPLYGVAMSPLVAGGTLIVHVGGNDDGALLALDANSGAEKWQWREDGPAYASPVLAVLDGTKQVITLSQNHLIGVDFQTGKTLWKLPYKTDYAQDIVTPVIYEGTVIYSGIGNGGSGRGVFRIRPVRNGAGWTTERVWGNSDVHMYMSSPVLHGDLVFGLAATNKGQLFCLDAKTGKTLWKGKPRQGDNGALLVQGNQLLLLTTEGELVAAEASGGGYKELRRYKVADSPTWAHAVPFGDGFFIKDETSVSLWR